MIQKNTRRYSAAIWISAICDEISIGDGEMMIIVYITVRFPYPMLKGDQVVAYQPLSIQVHPKSYLTSSKDELWYVVSAEPGAKIIYGLKDKVNKDQIKHHITKGTIELILNETKVRTGDIFSIPSGMIHSIGAGIVMFELQENSDITYRIYDWDRCSDRILHIDEALDAFSIDENMRNPRLEYKPETYEKFSLQRFPLKIILCLKL